MSHGLLMLDLEGTTLTSAERTLLGHTEVGGIILFSRNYQDMHQLMQLTKAIRGIRPDMLIAVDQEGGRVQRFKGEGFTQLPEMYRLSELFENDRETAYHIAHECGAVTGYELATYTIDINLAPVLDMNRHINIMLGNRCFGSTTETIIALTSAYIAGLTSMGLHAVGKHFPGHGGVSGDTHISLPRDNRTLEALQEDIRPFAAAIKQNISGLMPSHVIYPEVCPEPAGFSQYWLHNMLREKLAFKGAIFSDCLNMAAASVAGSFPERAEKALDAGCDMLLVCNNRQGALETLEWLKTYNAPVQKQKRLQKLRRQSMNAQMPEERHAALTTLLQRHHLLKHLSKREKVQ